MDEIAAKQRQREEEAEARRAVGKTLARTAAAVAVNAEPEAAHTPWRPSGGSWRDREAARAAANGESSPAPAAPPSERPRLNLPKPAVSRDRELSPTPTAPPSERPRLNLAKPTVSRDQESSPAPTAPPSERPRLNIAKPTISRDRARIPERPVEREVPERTSTPAENEAPKPGTYIPPGLRRKQAEASSSAAPPPQDENGGSRTYSKTQSSWGRGMGRRDGSDSRQ